MDFDAVVAARHMVRTYDPHRPVAAATVDALVDLARRGPSAGHTQGWHFLVLDTATSRRRFWSATADPSTDGATRWLAGMRTAPVLIVCLSDPDAYLLRYAEADKSRVSRRGTEEWPVPYWDVDVGMAALTILFGAVDRGLGAAWFGVPGERLDALHEALAVPSRLRVVGVVCLGHPAADRRSPSLRRGRRPRTDTVSYGRYGVPGRSSTGGD